MDGFHEGERRSTYSAANFVNIGPEAERRTGLWIAFHSLSTLAGSPQGDANT